MTSQPIKGSAADLRKPGGGGFNAIRAPHADQYRPSATWAIRRTTSRLSPRSLRGRCSTLGLISDRDGHRWAPTTGAGSPLLARCRCTGTVCPDCRPEAPAGHRQGQLQGFGYPVVPSIRHRRCRDDSIP